jgi:hypothetical protein
MTSLNKETNFSLHDIDNYKKEFEPCSSEIIVTVSSLVTEYLKFIFENITIKKKDYAQFVIIRGLNTIMNVFRNLLIYTKNIDLTYYHCQKSFYFYVEFVEQILEDDKSFLQLTSRDATIYVYKKTIYEINNEIKKNNNISIKFFEKLKIMNSYIHICHIYVNKILENPNFLVEKNNIIKIFDKTINQFYKIDSLRLFILNNESIQIIEKIIDKIDFAIKNVHDFFEVNNILFKKITHTPNVINKIYDKIIIEDFVNDEFNNEEFQDKNQDQQNMNRDKLLLIIL